MADQHFHLLFFTCAVALLAPLHAVDIENLKILKGGLEEIINLPPEMLPSDQDRGNLHQRRSSDSQQTEHDNLPKDCSEISTGSPSGVYIIQPTGLHPLVVYCEMNVTNGGWTVIQRNRHNTAITWAESWSTYQYGFGDVQSDYWLGTEYIYQIARQKVYQVKFVIWDARNATKFADYNFFGLEDESRGYQLRLGSYTGTAGDAMTLASSATAHDNMKFSAKDRDQDINSGNCASTYGGAWWFSSCYSVHLNFKGGLTWGSLCNRNCKASLILIKPASFC